MWVSKCPNQSLRTLSRVSLASPLVKYLDNVWMGGCENTAGDPPHDSLWAIGHVDDIYNTQQMQKWKRKKLTKYRRMKSGATYKDEKRAFGDKSRGRCQCAKNTWSSQRTQFCGHSSEFMSENDFTEILQTPALLSVCYPGLVSGLTLSPDNLWVRVNNYS